MPNPDPIERLSTVFAKLPGVGRRSAARMAQRVARHSGQLAADLIGALQDVRDRITTCRRCGMLTLKEQNPCTLCMDPRRDDHLLCVVEDPADIELIEQAGAFRGRYHSLLGKLSPMKGEGLDNPRITQLLDRVKKEDIKEVIMALNADVESDATASYLHDQLHGHGVRVTRLAYGIPAGSGIAYADPVTLSRALQGRQEM